MRVCKIDYELGHVSSHSVLSTKYIDTLRHCRRKQVIQDYKLGPFEHDDYLNIAPQR